MGPYPAVRLIAVRPRLPPSDAVIEARDAAVLR